jgi:predicted RNA binding protein YcfA (HicA-like mRNA interferase family)
MVPSKNERTLGQVRRLNGGLHWTRVQSLLSDLGAERYEGRGSAVTFVLDGVKLTVHRPHPRKECGRGLVKRIRDYLRTTGRLEE